MNQEQKTSRFPRLVESTIMHLQILFQFHSFLSKDATNPSCFPMISSKCKFSLRELNFQTPVCPSVLLKYALPPLVLGSMYQLPHRSLAITGLPYATATRWAKAASCRIDCRRFWMDRVERLSCPRVLEKL